MEIKEGIVIKCPSRGAALVQVDDEVVQCGMELRWVIRHFQIIEGDKVYLIGRKILSRREAMNYNLKWTINHSPVSPERYRYRFLKEEE